MSVAENPVRQRVPGSTQQQLAVGSAMGGVLLVAALWFIFAGLPLLWMKFWHAAAESAAVQSNEYLSGALLVLLEILVIAGLVFGAYRLSQAQPQPGIRAGSLAVAAGLVLSLWIGLSLGTALEHQFDDNPALGWAIVGVVIAALLAGIGYLFLMVPGWARFLEGLEEQGWFHLASYKGNQGVRVRRGTILGILAVGACGIWVATTHQFFGVTRTSYDWDWLIRAGTPAITIPLYNDWYWTVPFAQNLALPLMYRMHIIMPLLLSVLLLWMAWRVVNLPGFADFLIATEAEMNKVSWTSRKRLVQDTIVVLATVFLFTGFLFLVDIVWIKMLSNPYVQVLLYDPKAKEREQTKAAEW